jgi:hypothetical protein
MTIWRMRTLLDRLRQGQLSARQLLPYLITATVAATLIFVFTDWSRPWDRDEFATGVDSLTTLMNGLTSVIGLYACYRANGGVDGVQLAERICAIGVVLFLRFVVIGVLAFAIWAYVTVSLNLFRPSLEDFDLLSLLVVALFWVRLRSHVFSVAQPRAI